MSRDDGEYPAIAWGGQNPYTGAGEIYVSVPTDTGWTLVERIDGVSDAVFPVVARDLNGDVWVAFHRDYQSGLWWCHTYTHAISSVPIATSDGMGVSVQWTLSELAPETWWAVLRQRPDGSFEPIARVRAGSDLTMSWRDDSPPTGPHYRIRRECVDKHYEWVSDPSDTPVPDLPSIAEVQTASGQVTLSWFAPRDAGSTFVQRSSDGISWVDLGIPTSQTAGLLTFTDTGLEAKRYAYRLQVGSQFTPATWVDVPGFALALEGFRPNPAAGQFQVAFTLSNDSPASLEVYSVSGRRVLTREVGSLGAGNHVIDLNTTDVHAGVYWIRITEAAKVLTKKGVVIQ